MTFMNDNGKAQDQVVDFRSKPRWSADEKTDAVLRLLRGESLDELSRELGVEAIGWRRGATTSDYDPYGATLTTAPAGLDNPWGYTGEYGDPTGLYTIGIRYYHPDHGRWTQPDPLGNPLQPPPQRNRYAYVGCNPSTTTTRAEPARNVTSLQSVRLRLSLVLEQCCPGWRFNFGPQVCSQLSLQWQQLRLRSSIEGHQMSDAACTVVISFSPAIIVLGVGAIGERGRPAPFDPASGAACGSAPAGADAYTVDAAGRHTGGGGLDLGYDPAGHTVDLVRVPPLAPPS